MVTGGSEGRAAPAREKPGQQDSGHSVVTVLVAGAANLIIATAKAVAGLLSGSAAMLAEAAHSLADTVTEILLFTALRRGARPADERHPFGYGKESYVWALFAALFTFLAGAGFSIARGVETIVAGEETGDYLIAYIVLGVAFVAEGSSLARAVHQVRDSAERWRIGPTRFLRRTADTTVKAVVLEDSAALVGLVLAGAGLVLTEFTGSTTWDGVSSICIGVLLLVVAFVLARANVSLLVGRAVPPGLQRIILEELHALPGVEQVHGLLTMQLGPDDILVTAKVDFADEATGASIEAVAEDAERRLATRLPGVRYVFLDPTAREAGRQRPA